MSVCIYITDWGDRKILCSLVLLQPPKVRQRFTLKPKTPHIVCMRSIPGIIEQSKDFISSSIFAQKTDWVSASLFPASASGSSSMDHRRLSDVGPRRPRPKSASFAGRGGPADLMLASTPDLSQSGYSDPICVDQDLFTSTTSGKRINTILLELELCG